MVESVVVEKLDAKGFLQTWKRLLKLAAFDPENIAKLLDLSLAAVCTLPDDVKLAHQNMRCITPFQGCESITDEDKCSFH
jgi:hypothetical protein